MIPRVNIAHLPTAIERMPNLTAALNGPDLWVKRDDQTGLGFGGNKTRKLEFVLAEALDEGARTLVTVGAEQSNHCRQTAALAARFGLNCILVLSGEPPEKATGNLLLDELFGAEIVWTSRDRREQALQETFERALSDGRCPALIPLGASNPTGALGYFFAFEELLAQNASPDWIVVASSSAGTQAGLAFGAKKTGWQGKVLGISIDHPVDELQHSVAALANAAARKLGESVEIDPGEVLVNADYLGAGYGILGELELEAIRLFARHEGLLLDPVYTGRAAGAMIDLIRRGFFKPGEEVLFWHTGGAPALFAEQYVNALQ